MSGPHETQDGHELMEAFLFRAVESVGRRSGEDVSLFEISRAMGIDHEEHRRIVCGLSERRLIKGLSIDLAFALTTPAGVDACVQGSIMARHHTQVLNNYGTINGPAVQQGDHNHFNIGFSNDRNEYYSLIEAIGAVRDRLELLQREDEYLQQQIDIVLKQLERPRGGNSLVLTGALKSIQHICEGAAGNAAGTGIIAMIQHILNQLN